MNGHWLLSKTCFRCEFRSLSINSNHLIYIFTKTQYYAYIYTQSHCEYICVYDFSYVHYSSSLNGMNILVLCQWELFCLFAIHLQSGNVMWQTVVAHQATLDSRRASYDVWCVRDFLVFCLKNGSLIMPINVMCCWNFVWSKCNRYTFDE